MALSTSQNADSSPTSFHDYPENNLQPFFVLHRSSSSSCSSARPKSRRKLDEDVHELDDHYLNNLRTNAFHSVWSNIDTTVKDVLMKNNISIFNEVNSWVHSSFKEVRSCGELGFAEATQPYPAAIDALKNMEFVDDQLTFEELGKHLKSCGSHVANMSSLDFSAKNGIGGCLNCLLRKFLTVPLDDADLSILASWYCGQRGCMPVVIIIEDMERCCASVLSDFILTLSKWVVKIPVILIMGIATTLDALGSVLSSHALLCLCTCKFILSSPVQRMDDIVEAVLLRPCSNFHVGHKVALFMRDYFLKHDGTLNSFIRALKIACMQHFWSEPLSFLLKDLDAESDFQEICKEKHAFIQNMVLAHSSQLPSGRSEKDAEPTSENLVKAIRELRKVHQHWATIIMCLHEVGRLLNVPLLDLYNEALDPDAHRSRTTYEGRFPSMSRSVSSQHGGPSKSTSIFNIVQKVRELPAAGLSKLLNSWERLTVDVCEIGAKVKELQVMMNSEDNKSSGSDLLNVFSSNSLGTTGAKDPKVLNGRAVALIESMIRDQMTPIECLEFHEVLCFKKVDKLQTALLGDTRKRIQADMLEFHKFLSCSCCSKTGSRLLPSLHDSSILYSLTQEHGDIINVHDWFQSFKAIYANPIKARSKSKHSSTPKKKKDIHQMSSYSEAEIQARFCKAVAELQVAGLLRMPSKRRPDFVQRVAFGI